MVARLSSDAGRAAWLVASALAGTGLFGCRPNLPGRPSLIDQSRVLAVKSVPAEQAPGDMAGVQYTALFASPDEAASPSGIEWAMCNIRKPIAVIGPAALECLAPSGKGLLPIGKGEMVDATIDKDDCSVFGPSPPMPKEGEPASRPADPDTTGGYYQPVRVLVPTEGEPDYVIGVTRLVCGLAGATQDQSLEYADQYRPNENPTIAQITVKHSGGATETLDISDSVQSITVARGEPVTFRVSWAACPTTSTCGDGICGAGEYAEMRKVMGMVVPACPDDCMMPKGCTGSEPYVVLDPVARAIVPRREAMRVSWFATDGSYAHDRTGRTEGDASHAFSENVWVAPNRTGKVRFWAVLRDDRGGVGWAELSIDVSG